MKKIAILGSLSQYPHMKRIKKVLESKYNVNVTIPPLCTDNLDLEALERGEKKTIHETSEEEIISISRKAEKKWMNVLNETDMVYVIPKPYDKNNVGMNTSWEILYAIIVGKPVYSEKKIDSNSLEEWVKEYIKVLPLDGLMKLLENVKHAPGGI